jgi:hypothetical protein
MHYFLKTIFCDEKEGKMLNKVIQLFLVGSLILTMTAISKAGQLNSGEHVYPEVPRIGAFEAKELFDQGKLILVDALEPASYKARHICGAIQVQMDVDLPENVIIAFY